MSAVRRYKLLAVEEDSRESVQARIVSEPKTKWGVYPIHTFQVGDEVVEAAAYEAVCEQLRLANIDQANTEAKLNDAKRDLATVQGERERLFQVIELYRSASYQSHSGHFDPTGGSGSGCPACLRAIELRADARAILDSLAQPAAPISEVCQHASTRWVLGMYEKTQECCACGAELDERKL